MAEGVADDETKTRKQELTVYDFFRELAKPGGFLGRKHDGEPGWQSIWAGYKKLHGRIDGIYRPLLCLVASTVSGTGIYLYLFLLSGQRMMRMKTRKASGRASALRANRTARSTTIFKTRFQPCRIAVRADPGKSVNSDDQWANFGGIFTSSWEPQSRMQSVGHRNLRFAEHRTLKTEN